MIGSYYKTMEFNNELKSDDEHELIDLLQVDPHIEDMEVQLEDALDENDSTEKTLDPEQM